MTAPSPRSQPSRRRARRRPTEKKPVIALPPKGSFAKKFQKWNGPSGQDRSLPAGDRD